jgi:hypothetical protein
MTEGSDYGFNARGARFGDQGANGAPDFARNDRGDADDHWSRSDGEACARCDAELTPRDFIRRRADGTWVHESCPPTRPNSEGSVSEQAADAE